MIKLLTQGNDCYLGVPSDHKKTNYKQMKPPWRIILVTQEHDYEMDFGT
jgi:hypothetical protein